MNTPNYIYHYRRPVNPRTGKPGTRYDLVGRDGSGPYPILDTAKLRDGTQIVYLNKPRVKSETGLKSGRSDLILAAPNRKSLSSIYEPEPEAPGYGFGDIGRFRPGEDGILTKRDDEAGTLEIAVFKGLGRQTTWLFHAWLAGGVCWQVYPLISRDAI